MRLVQNRSVENLPGLNVSPGSCASSALELTKFGQRFTEQ